MKKFKLLLMAFFLMLFISACDSKQSQDEELIHICPQCNMELSKSKLNTAIIKDDNKVYYFDDPGCMILWVQAHELNYESIAAKIFSKDTKEYISILNAFYTINEKTPMKYGFCAYKNEQNATIRFTEVKMRMLRGEHMANPKIRKHILGY